MTNWKEYKVEDFAEVIGGGTPSTKNDAYFGGSIPWITPRDLTNYDRKFIKNGDRNITKEGLKNSSAKLIPKNAILLTSRAPIGYLVIAQNEVSTNQGFKSIVVNPEIADYNFIFYLIKANIERIKSFGTGTTFAEVSASIVKNLKFNLPDLPTQTAIAEILSSLDDKIELNNKINQELENLAQTLFKQWFIDFEFPNQNGEPYKSSGGEMVDSELGEIPKGWEVGIFGEICKLSTGKGIKKKDYLFDGSYPVIGANGVMGFYDKFNTEGFKILTGRVGTLGTVRINTEKVWTSDNVIVCSPKSEELDHFAYYVLSSFNFEALNRGSTQPLLTQTDLKSQVIIIPSFNVLKTFNFQLDSQYSIVSNNKNENKELTNLRDTLLPKLISGELEVKKT